MQNRSGKCEEGRVEEGEGGGGEEEGRGTCGLCVHAEEGGVKGWKGRKIEGIRQGE